MPPPPLSISRKTGCIVLDHFELYARVLCSPYFQSECLMWLRNVFLMIATCVVS